MNPNHWHVCPIRKLRPSSEIMCFPGVLKQKLWIFRLNLSWPKKLPQTHSWVAKLFYGVEGCLPLVSVSQGKFVLGERPYKAQFKKTWWWIPRICAPTPTWSKAWGWSQQSHWGPAWSSSGGAMGFSVMWIWCQSKGRGFLVWSLVAEAG